MIDDKGKRNEEGWIGVDFDGTLAHYDHFRGDDHFGEPLDGMVCRVRNWIKAGKDVRLFTARRPSPGLRRWMAQHLGAVLPVATGKDHNMIALYDDRAITVPRNSGEPLEGAEKAVGMKSTGGSGAT